MSINKPFYRIARPGVYIPDYVVDARYASDRLQLSRAYINLEKKLREIFEYIEPGDKNKDTFSFELYNLLLAACTEVELNCKEILKENGASANNMGDYVKLERSSLLSKYEVSYNRWRKKDQKKRVVYEKYDLKPFASFCGDSPKEPEWYKAYNDVKHEREKNLELATLANCMNAVAGVLVLLYSQFGSKCIVSNISYGQDNEGYDDIFAADVICPPKIDDWNQNDLYSFDWNIVKGYKKPFGKFRY